MCTSLSHGMAPWKLWWQWTGASAFGAAVAALLYTLLPDAITHPDVMFDDWQYYVATPWRYLTIYGVVYGAFSLAQWHVLRRYVPHAWQWVLVTTASAALLFPATMSFFTSIGLRGLAEMVWSAGIDYPFGIGGHALAVVGQWIILHQWTRRAWLWPASAPIIGVVTSFADLLVPVRLEHWLNLDGYQVFIFVWGTLNYACMGIVLAVLLHKHRHRVGTASVGSTNAEAIQ